MTDLRIALGEMVPTLDDADGIRATSAEIDAGVEAQKWVSPAGVRQAIDNYAATRFATAAQGALADSAVQPGALGNSAALDVGTAAGTVAAGDHGHSGVYEPADATILKDADIGVTVQAYSANLGNVREVLTANRTYYVRTDGSDSNTGLVDSAGGAFLTIQKAVNVVAAIDLAGNTVTIDVGNGTYAGDVTLKTIVGGECIIVGDETTPSNVVVSSGTCFSADGTTGIWHLRGMRLTATVHGMSVQNGAAVKFQNIDFGTITYYGVLATGGRVIATGNYTISGSCNTHINLFLGASFQCQSRTITIIGTPAWGNAFISAGTASSATINGNTYSGAATGKRYVSTGNSAINTAGGGANYFPGDVAGTTTADQEYA